MWNYKTKTIILLALCLTISCLAQKRTLFKDASKHGLNVYLWKTSNNIWINSFENRIIELIERGAEIDYISEHSSFKTTPFLNASGIIERLEKQKHYTPEEIEAFEKEAVKIVKYLAKKGANVRAINVSHQNALHLAALGGREKVIPYLIDLGLDVNARDSTSYTFTPLILAITTGDLATVKVLVKAGADINKCSATGNTPLDWATGYASGNNYSYPYKDQQAILEYLLSIGAKHGKNDLHKLITF